MAEFDPTQSASGTALQPAGVPAPPRQVAPGVYMTGFGDPTVKKYEFDLYAGRKDHTDRLAILMPETVTKGRIHFHDSPKIVGGVLCQSAYERSQDGTSEYLTREANCCKWLGQPQTRFGVFVVHYTTDKDGNFIRDNFGYTLKLWRFGADKYIQLGKIHRDFPLDRCDIRVSCEDDKFQRLQMFGLPESTIRHPQFPKDKQEQIQTWLRNALPKLPNELGGRAVPDGDLFKMVQEAGILSAAPGTGPVFTQQDQPIASFGDIIGQASPTQ